LPEAATSAGDFRRLPNVEEQHIGPPQQSLGFIRADTRHFGIGFGQHGLDCFHFVSFVDA
jgi:hypothetical protein